jgi:Protein of unknown function (DUF1566)
MTEAATLEPGTRMEDGSVYAGLTADGKLILAMPADLPVTLTFNDAAKAVKKLNADNALGHDDWQIPVLENLCVMQKNRDEGKLKGSFKTASSSGSTSPDWYWSRTPGRDYPTLVDGVRFSDGYEVWAHKDFGRLSCRPVRLVPVGAL